MAVTTLRGFINGLAEVVQQTKVNRAMSLANGSCPGMDQYHRRVGQLEGMDECVKLAREMLGQLESQAEDADGLPEMPPVQPQRKARSAKK